MARARFNPAIQTLWVYLNGKGQQWEYIPQFQSRNRDSYS